MHDKFFYKKHHFTRCVFCIFQGKPVGAALTLHACASSSGEEVDSGGNGMGRGGGY